MTVSSKGTGIKKSKKLEKTKEGKKKKSGHKTRDRRGEKQFTTRRCFKQRARLKGQEYVRQDLHGGHN